MGRYADIERIFEHALTEADCLIDTLDIATFCPLKFHAAIAFWVGSGCEGHWHNAHLSQILSAGLLYSQAKALLSLPRAHELVERIISALSINGGQCFASQAGVTAGMLTFHTHI